MPNGPHNVDLTIDASNQYQFTGGNQGNGNCQNEVGKGAAPVLITLHAAPGYAITGVPLTGPGSENMTSRVMTPKFAKIDNSCQDKAQVEYTVNVQAPGGTTIPCHPKIVNT